MITDHVFRILNGGRVPFRGCGWLGRCGKAEREHVSRAAFRASHLRRTR